MAHLNTKHFTRGGQITLHNIRMWMQISNKIVLCGFIIFILVTGTLTWTKVSPYHRYIFSEYLWSQVLSWMPDVKIKLIEPNGHIIKMCYADFAALPVVKTIVHQVALQLFYAAFIGGVASLLSMLGISYWLKRRGKSATENTLIKGDEFATRKDVKARIIKNKMDANLSLAGLPLIKDMETRHFFFHGTTGSGKSNAIKELLDQIRDRGDKAIIYDMSCNYLEEFYTSKDKILNPMDVRGESWHLWNECRDSADYDSFAAAQIPMPLSSQDPFWVNAARTIFAAAAFEMRNDPERNIIKLLRYLLTADLDRMESYLKGTEAETLASRKTEKTAISIKSVIH